MSDQPLENMDVDEFQPPSDTLADDQILEDSVESVMDVPVETPSPDSSPDTREVTVESVIEAVLFASDEPITLNKLGMVVELTGKQVRHAIAALNERYQNHGHAFRIETIAGGFQMLTLPGYESWLRKLVRARGDSKLSPAALETLAVVAYKQPAIRADIEAIRGVASGEILRSLMVKGLVKIVGRAEIIGRPMLYGTTRKFLEVFGLNSLKDLPTIEELKKPEDPPETPPVEPKPADPTPAEQTPAETSPAEP